MVDPTLYQWRDSGSPARNLSGNLQNHLKQILVPCLVTGYGDKPAAGWTLEHEHDNGFALANSRKDFYVNFVSTLPAQAPYPQMNARVIHVYTANSLVNNGTAIIDGANLCSGTYRKNTPEPEVAGFPRHSIVSAGYCLVDQSSSLQWSVVADGNTFVASFSSGNSASGVSPFCFSFYAGDIENDVGLVTPIALSGSISNYGASGGSSYGYCVGYSAPLSPLTGLGETAELWALPFGVRHTHSVSKYISENTSSRLNLIRPPVWLADPHNAVIGSLRGVATDHVLHEYGDWMYWAQNLGIDTADYSNRDIPVQIDGYDFVFSRHNSGNGSLITNHPGFW